MLPLRLALPLTCLAILTACAHPPKLAATLDILRNSDNLVLLKLKITNLDDSATVPIAVQITGQAQINGQWDKPGTVLQPAAFVLNRKEDRTITKLWHVSAQAVRTTLTIREQETGNLLKSEKSEKSFSAAPTSQP